MSVPQFYLDEEEKIDNKKKQKTLQLEKRTTTSYKVSKQS